MDNNLNQDAGLSALLDFGFNRFITLSVMKIVYMIGLALIALSWLVFSALAIFNDFLTGIGILIVGAIIALLYMVFFRMWLELIVVLFRIGENTRILVELGGGTPAGGSDAAGGDAL